MHTLSEYSTSYIHQKKKWELTLYTTYYSCTFLQGLHVLYTALLCIINTFKKSNGKPQTCMIDIPSIRVTNLCRVLGVNKSLLLQFVYEWLHDTGMPYLAGKVLLRHSTVGSILGYVLWLITHTWCIILWIWIFVYCRSDNCVLVEPSGKVPYTAHSTWHTMKNTYIHSNKKIWSTVELHTAEAVTFCRGYTKKWSYGTDTFPDNVHALWGQHHDNATLTTRDKLNPCGWY